MEARIKTVPFAVALFASGAFTTSVHGNIVQTGVGEARATFALAQTGTLAISYAGSRLRTSTGGVPKYPRVLHDGGGTRAARSTLQLSRASIATPAPRFEPLKRPAAVSARAQQAPAYPPQRIVAADHRRPLCLLVGAGLLGWLGIGRRKTIQ